MQRPLLLALLLGGVGFVAPQPAEAQTAARPSEDEQAIRKDVEEYSAAYNKGDIEAAGRHWTDDAEYINDEGKTTKGRDAIVSLFKRGRVARKGNTFKATVQSVRILKPDVALEDGTVILTGPDGTPEKTRFTAVLLKSEGKWRISRVQDLPSVADSEEPTPYQKLKQLEWLVGEWQDEEKDTNIHMTCRWAPVEAFWFRNTSLSVRTMTRSRSTSHRLGSDQRSIAELDLRFARRIQRRGLAAQRQSMERGRDGRVARRAPGLGTAGLVVYRRQALPMAGSRSRGRQPPADRFDRQVPTRRTEPDGGSRNQSTVTRHQGGSHMKTNILLAALCLSLVAPLDVFAIGRGGGHGGFAGGSGRPMAGGGRGGFGGGEAMHHTPSMSGFSGQANRPAFRTAGGGMVPHGDTERGKAWQYQRATLLRKSFRRPSEF